MVSALAALLLLGATAQYDCTAPATTPWMTPGGYKAKATDSVPLWLVFHVNEAGRAAALARLDRKPAVALSSTAARRLAARSIIPETRRANGAPFVADWFKGRKPYLVRAVYPSSEPSLSVDWAGDALLVRADGMGCVPFRNEPLIVWLDRAPNGVLVTASAAL